MFFSNVFYFWLAILGVWYGLMVFAFLCISNLLTAGISSKLASRAPTSEYTEHQSSCLEFVTGKSPIAITHMHHENPSESMRKIS